MQQCPQWRGSDGSSAQEQCIGSALSGRLCWDACRAAAVHSMGRMQKANTAEHLMEGCAGMHAEQLQSTQWDACKRQIQQSTRWKDVLGCKQGKYISAFKGAVLRWAPEKRALRCETGVHKPAAHATDHELHSSSAAGSLCDWQRAGLQWS
eukprot:1137828-Pelagomonas_calceolata.AAC.16